MRVGVSTEIKADEPRLAPAGVLELRNAAQGVVVEAGADVAPRSDPQLQRKQSEE